MKKEGACYILQRLLMKRIKRFLECFRQIICLIVSNFVNERTILMYAVSLILVREKRYLMTSLKCAILTAIQNVCFPDLDSSLPLEVQVKD